jgi:hypothetical protein
LRTGLGFEDVVTEGLRVAVARGARGARGVRAVGAEAGAGGGAGIPWMQVLNGRSHRSQ